MSDTGFQKNCHILQSFLRCELLTSLAKNGQIEQFVFTGLYIMGKKISYFICVAMLAILQAAYIMVTMVVLFQIVLTLDSIQYGTAKSECTIFKIYFVFFNEYFAR